MVKILGWRIFRVIGSALIASLLSKLLWSFAGPAPQFTFAFHMMVMLVVFALIEVFRRPPVP